MSCAPHQWPKAVGRQRLIHASRAYRPPPRRVAMTLPASATRPEYGCARLPRSAVRQRRSRPPTGRRPAPATPVVPGPSGCRAVVRPAAGGAARRAVGDAGSPGRTSTVAVPAPAPPRPTGPRTEIGIDHIRCPGLDGGDHRQRAAHRTDRDDRDRPHRQFDNHPPVGQSVIVDQHNGTGRHRMRRTAGHAGPLQCGQSGGQCGEQHIGAEQRNHAPTALSRPREFGGNGMIRHVSVDSVDESSPDQAYVQPHNHASSLTGCRWR